MKNIIHIDYSGKPFDFREDGWFNATLAAERFGKEPFKWLNQRDTAEYIAALTKHINGNSYFLEEFSKISLLDSTSAASQAKLLRLVKNTGLVKTKQGAFINGGGTWLHPKLAIPFARWLDVEFSIWCDMQIDDLLRGKDDWRKLRHEAASTYKVMQDILKDIRTDAGKTTESYHYSNEARLINWALTGEFCTIDRWALDNTELDLLAALEKLNAVMLGRGKAYQERKDALHDFALSKRIIMIGNAA